ncbi:hypothetical protein IFM89_014845 [Coptis chinensis]|uniref:Helicase ATP-binding domain-containing protein n=1 Tax=Coptis chinensis TaxID=261450 RepID=A0A835I7V1_9MAGN|nr:hypothetical protein IFM89_014845 [Coptis chinensis]
MDREHLPSDINIVNTRKRKYDIPLQDKPSEDASQKDRNRTLQENDADSCPIPESNNQGLAETGSGKTTTFALPILQKLAENRYGVYALVITPTRELAFQLADQSKALGSSLSLRCSVIVGGMDMIEQGKVLMSRPHVIIATPGED